MCIELLLNFIITKRLLYFTLNRESTLIVNNQNYSLSFRHIGSKTRKSGIILSDTNPLCDPSTHIAATVVTIDDTVYVAVTEAVDQ